MKTLIELYDKEAIENVYATLSFRPEQVVCVGDSRLMTPEKQENLRRFYAAKKLPCKLAFYPAQTNDLPRLKALFEEIAARYEDCVCDVTGGTDLLLVTAGMLAEKRKLPVIFFDIHTDRFINLGDLSPAEGPFERPRLSVEDLMLLAGGSFIRHGHYTAELDEPETRETIERIWEVARKNIPEWGTQVTYFQAAARAKTDEEKAELAIDTSLQLYNGRERLTCNLRILRRLEECGALADVRIDGKNLSYRYTAPVFKHLLSDAGVWLELYTYYTAQKSGFFDDCKTSVLIDWDGDNDPTGTTNELDDILTKGAASLFISCKLGIPSLFAIIEIDTLTRRFGGELAKAVLVTASPFREIPEATRQRARDMGVTILSIDRLSDEEFSERLMKLVEERGKPFARR